MKIIKYYSLKLKQKKIIFHSNIEYNISLINNIISELFLFHSIIPLYFYNI